MTKDYSPFTPGVPVPKELFVGRKEEIERLKTKVAQATCGRLQVAFLSGERGIGKSSLAAFTKYLVERELNVIGIHANLGGVSSLEEMARKVFDRLLKDSVDKVWYEKVKDLFGKHIKQIGLFGFNFEFDAPKEDLRYLVRNLAFALSNLLKQLKDEKKGIFLILDDINGLAGSQEFADWLKSFIDEVATNSVQLPLCLLIVGYEERRQSLCRLQPSLARVFDLIDIPVWSNEETSDFFRTAFNEVGITINDETLAQMADYVGGLPVLAHEIGDAVFNEDKDGEIGGLDLLIGAMKATEILGHKFLDIKALNKIQDKKYLNILWEIVTKTSDLEFKRAEIREKLKESEKKLLDPFLGTMTDVGVFIRQRPGDYRFVTLLHFLYFKVNALRAMSLKVMGGTG